MPGESILIVDDSLAVQDIVHTALNATGYHVTAVSNGVAALTYPGLEDTSLLIIDGDMAGISGEETTRLFKQNGLTHPIPVLLLVPEGQNPRENPHLAGAQGYLLKPFDPQALVRKVEQMLEQQNLDDLSRQYLSDAADRKMKDIAEQHITQAVERKTQLIIERCIHNVTAQVDQRARQEIESRITGLVSEKEQELVKLTVREVANSMVEKLAAAKVEEAMQAILREETEKVIKRVTDTTLPNLIRDKSKEMLTNILPREVDKQLRKATDKMVPEISQQIVGMVDAVAGKNVPRVARELLPPVIETQIAAALDQSLPRRVAELAARELDNQMSQRMEPAIRDAASRIQRTLLWVNVSFGGALLALAGIMAWLVWAARHS